MGTPRTGRYQRLGNGDPLDIMQPESAQQKETTETGRSSLPLVLALFALVGIGILIVDSRSLAVPGDSSGSWVGLGTVIDGTPADPQTRAVRRIDLQPSIFDEVQQSAPFSYIAPSSAGGAQPVQVSAEDARDLDDILASLSPDIKQSWQVDTTLTGEPSWAQAYSFIPTGLVSTSTRTTSRTDTQQRLYDYGNSAGSQVQSFEATHRNASQIAADQLADRANPAKAAALRQLGADYTALGKRLLTIENPPSQISREHTALAQSYITLGGGLAAIADAQTDQQLITSVTAYNKTADAQIRAYNDIVSILSANSVTFSPDDPGSAFTFNPQQ